MENKKIETAMLDVLAELTILKLLMNEKNSDKNRKTKGIENKLRVLFNELKKEELL